MTIGVGGIDRHPDAPWMTTLAAAMTTLTGVTIHRRPIRTVMAGRMTDHRRGTSRLGITDTPGMAGMAPGTMIGAVTGKSNHSLRPESLLNRRTRSRSPRAARIFAVWQRRLVFNPAMFISKLASPTRLTPVLLSGKVDRRLVRRERLTVCVFSHLIWIKDRNACGGATAGRYRYDGVKLMACSRFHVLFLESFQMNMYRTCMTTSSFNSSSLNHVWPSEKWVGDGLSN